MDPYPVPQAQKTHECQYAEFGAHRWAEPHHALHPGQMRRRPRLSARRGEGIRNEPFDCHRHFAADGEERLDRAGECCQRRTAEKPDPYRAGGTSGRTDRRAAPPKRAAPDGRVVPRTAGAVFGNGCAYGCQSGRLTRKPTGFRCHYDAPRTGMRDASD